MENVGVWDVLQNDECAWFSEPHRVGSPPDSAPQEEVDSCTIKAVQCKTRDEFDKLTHSAMRD